MDLFETIHQRRSIRKFTGQPVPEAMLDKLLKAGMAAPSAGNQQAWHFIVIDDRDLLDHIPAFHPHARMVNEAPVVVMVCGDNRLEKLPGYWVQDCSAATQNILLAAHGVGLGAVWLGVYPKEDRINAARTLLRLPQEVTPLCMIALGYPGETPEPANRYQPDRVHRNGW